MKEHMPLTRQTLSSQLVTATRGTNYDVEKGPNSNERTVLNESLFKNPALGFLITHGKKNLSIFMNLSLVKE